MNCSSHLRQSLKIRLTLFTPVTLLIKRSVPIQQFEALVTWTFLDTLGGGPENEKGKIDARIELPATTKSSHVVLRWGRPQGILI